MAVGNEQVQPAIVVVIEEAASEAQNVVRWRRDPDRVTDLVEVSFAIIVPNMIGGTLEIGDVQIQPTIIIVIRERNAHRSHEMAT